MGNNKIDWEQRRYEIVKELFGRYSVVGKLVNTNNESYWIYTYSDKEAAELSISSANELIKQLKRK